MGIAFCVLKLKSAHMILVEGHAHIVPGEAIQNDHTSSAVTKKRVLQ